MTTTTVLQNRQAKNQQKYKKLKDNKNRCRQISEICDKKVNKYVI